MKELFLALGLVSSPEPTFDLIGFYSQGGRVHTALFAQNLTAEHCEYLRDTAQPSFYVKTACVLK